MKHREGHRKSWLIPILIAGFVAGTLLGAGPAAAIDTLEIDGICMQRAFMGPNATVAPSNLLNCSANDIRLSSAVQETISPESCDPDAGPFTLEVDFRINVTANDRYDAAFFFRVDGVGANARGDGTETQGACSVIALDPTSPNVKQEDGDTCGDLDQGPITLRFSIPNVACVPAPNTTPPQVRLPYCTAWHSNQGTVATCSPTPNPFSLKPDTKAKCSCDDGFFVPVVVVQPAGDVAKTAISALVTYQVDVTNSSAFPVDLKALSDSRYGNLFNDKNTPSPNTNNNIEKTLCAAVTNIAAGATSTCTFQVLVDNPGTTVGSPPAIGAHPNTVTATLHRTDGSGDDQTFTGNTSITIDLGADNRP